MLSFIITHIEDFITALTSIVTGASVLTALTPTQKDDNIVGKVKKVLNICALNVANAKTA